MSAKIKQKNKWKGTSLKFCTLWYIVADFDWCLTLEGNCLQKKLNNNSQITIFSCYHNPYLWQITSSLRVLYIFGGSGLLCGVPSHAGAVEILTLISGNFDWSAVLSSRNWIGTLIEYKFKISFKPANNGTPESRKIVKWPQQQLPPIKMK